MIEKEKTLFSIFSFISFRDTFTSPHMKRENCKEKRDEIKKIYKRNRHVIMDSLSLDKHLSMRIH